MHFGNSFSKRVFAVRHSRNAFLLNHTFHYQQNALNIAKNCALERALAAEMTRFPPSPPTFHNESSLIRTATATVRAYSSKFPNGDNALIACHSVYSTDDIINRIEYVRGFQVELIAFNLLQPDRLQSFAVELQTQCHFMNMNK